MKQFAAGTAMLKTPRPVTFELAFLAVLLLLWLLLLLLLLLLHVAVTAACETSHILSSLWEGGACLTPFGVPLPLEAGQLWTREDLGVWGLVPYPGCPGDSLGLICPV